MKKSLETILQEQSLLWRAGEMRQGKRKGITTGYAQLDEILPGAGWPSDALVEVISSRWGIGEFQLLLPALVQLSQQSQRIVWIAPPFVPYAPALLNYGIAMEQVLVVPAEKVKASVPWTMEKILKTRSCGIAMSWSRILSGKTIRRLQLAAEAGSSLGFLFSTVEAKSSPVALRIRIQPIDQGLQVEILKARGGGRFKPIIIPLLTGLK